MCVCVLWGLREYGVFTYLSVNCVFRWLNVAVPGKRNSFRRLICVYFSSPACARPPDTCFELMALLLLDIQQIQCSMYDRKRSDANFLPCCKTAKEKHGICTSLPRSILCSPPLPSPLHFTLPKPWEEHSYTCIWSKIFFINLTRKFRRSWSSVDSLNDRLTVGSLNVSRSPLDTVLGKLFYPFNFLSFT